jgi:hypothetical protein
MLDSCPCGTGLKTLERITQRLSGLIPIGTRYLTMADLDEALFAIDGVLNFTAQFAACCEDCRGSTDDAHHPVDRGVCTLWAIFQFARFNRRGDSAEHGEAHYP